MTKKRDELFRVAPHRDIDKFFMVEGPINLRVDNDDVDAEEQDILSRQVVRILNDNWNDGKYAGFRAQLARLEGRRGKE